MRPAIWGSDGGPRINGVFACVHPFKAATVLAVTCLQSLKWSLLCLSCKKIVKSKFSKVFFLNFFFFNRTILRWATYKVVIVWKPYPAFNKTEQQVPVWFYRFWHGMIKCVQVSWNLQTPCVPWYPPINLNYYYMRNSYVDYCLLFFFGNNLLTQSHHQPTITIL